MLTVLQMGHPSLWHRKRAFLGAREVGDMDFAFEVGDRPYLADSLAEVSNSVYRVIILSRESVAGINRYLVVPVRIPGAEPVLIREAALSSEPYAAYLDDSQRARWRTHRGRPTVLKPKRRFTR